MNRVIKLIENRLEYLERWQRVDSIRQQFNEPLMLKKEDLQEISELKIALRLIKQHKNTISYGQ